MHILWAVSGSAERALGKRRHASAEIPVRHRKSPGSQSPLIARTARQIRALLLPR